MPNHVGMVVSVESDVKRGNKWTELEKAMLFFSNFIHHSRQFSASK